MADQPDSTQKNFLLSGEFFSQKYCYYLPNPVKIDFKNEKKTRPELDPNQISLTQTKSH